MDLQITFIFLSLFWLSAFFSASEIALMSLSPHKIDSFIKQNKFWSKDLKFIKQKNDKLLISILILNNLVNIYAAAFATQIAINISKTSSLEESLIVWISTWIVTFFIIMFGEIIPKSYATKNIDSIALFVAKFYKFIIIIFTPLLFFIEIINKIFSWKSKQINITDEEIESFIDLWMDNWVLEPEEHEKIKNMLEFSDVTVESIHTHRVKIDALEINTTISDAIEFVLKNTHSRIPIYEETIDNIEYIVNLRFLIEEFRKWNWDLKLSELKNLTKAIKIPLNYPIDKLLEIFKMSKIHLAIVLDEYWWVAWLVTLEDIIEEVFWDIQDEYDKEKKEIIKVWENKYEVSPSVIFEDLLDELNLSFYNIWLDEKEYYATTLNYFITEELERFPKTWEVLEKKLTWEWFDDENILISFKIKNVVDSIIDSIEVEITKKEFL